MAFQYVIVKNSGRGRGYLPTIMDIDIELIRCCSPKDSGNSLDGYKLFLHNTGTSDNNVISYNTNIISIIDKDDFFVNITS